MPYLNSSLAVPAAVLAVTIGLIFGPTLHQVPEGHVAVYWLGGAMTSAVAPPGFHLKMPLITTVGIVQTSLQTDTIHNIPCGTHGGTVINFERVEVVNRLKLTHVHPTVKAYGPLYDKIWIHDKVHHEINQFCSKHTLQDVLIDKFSTIDEQMQSVLQTGCDKYDTGIEIFAVRVTKPAIPASIMRNYEKMEEEKSKLLIREESRKVMELEAETQKLRDIIKAQQEAEVSAIEQETAVRVKQTDQATQEIEDAVHLHRSKAFADATLYEAQKTAEADALYLSDEYLALLAVEAVTEKTTIVYGDDIPDMITSGGALQDPAMSRQQRGLQEPQQP